MFSSRRGRMQLALSLLGVGVVVCVAAFLVTLMHAGSARDLVVSAGGAVLAAAAGVRWRREMLRGDQTKVPPVIGAVATMLGASVLGRQLTGQGAGSWVDWTLTTVSIVVGTIALALVVTDIRDDPERGPDH